MKIVKPTEVGNDPKSRLVAFGDECHFNDILLYAFASFSRADLNTARSVLAETKKTYAIPADERLHCSVLFAGDQRKKRGMSHLNRDSVKTLLMTLIQAMNSTEYTLHYSYCPVDELDQFVKSVSDTYGQAVTMHASPKGMLGVLAQACFKMHPNDKKGIPVSTCEVFVSADETKIRFLGPNKKKASHWATGGRAQTNEKGDTIEFTPNILAMKAEPLLEYADVLAYSAAHSLSRCADQRFFTEAIEAIRQRQVFKVVPMGTSTSGLPTDPTPPETAHGS